MTENTYNMRVMSYDASDILIEALVPAQGGDNKFYRVAFKASEITHMVEINDKVSGLVLKNNISIPVAMPFDDLQQKIYAIDLKSEPVLDLKKVTGEVVQDILVPQLADTFNKKAESFDTSSIRIYGIFRQPETYECATFSFLETDVSFRPIDTYKSKSNKGIEITFNKSAAKCPFGNRAVLDMPYEDFIYFLTNAKKTNKKELNLFTVFASNRSKYGVNS